MHIMKSTNNTNKMITTSTSTTTNKTTTTTTKIIIIIYVLLLLSLLSKTTTSLLSKRKQQLLLSSQSKIIILPYNINNNNKRNLQKKEKIKSYNNNKKNLLINRILTIHRNGGASSDDDKSNKSGGNDNNNDSINNNISIEIYDSDEDDNDDDDIIMNNSNNIIELNPNYKIKKKTKKPNKKKLKRKKYTSSLSYNNNILYHYYNSTKTKLFLLKNITSSIIIEKNNKYNNKNIILYGIILYLILQQSLFKKTKQNNNNKSSQFLSILFKNMIILSTDPIKLMKFLLFTDIIKKVIFLDNTNINNSKNALYIPNIYQTLSFERIHLRQTQNILAYKRVLDLSSSSSYNNNNKKKKLLFLPPLITKYNNNTNTKSHYYQYPINILYYGLSYLKNYTRNKFYNYNDNNKLLSKKNNKKENNNNTIFIIEFKDLPPNKLSNQLLHLQQSIDFLLQLPSSNNNTTNTTEVIIQLTSQGGTVSDYGLASYYISTLTKQKQKQQKYNVTIFIDTIAASGGYLMACQGNTIYATPSSIVGSIGVITQSINFYHLLNKFGIYNQVFRSNISKAPITSFGPIHNDSEIIMQRLITRVYDYFCYVVQEQRYCNNNNNTTIDIDILKENIFNGDIFLGYEALKYNLIDGIMSSEEYIQNKIMDGYNVLKIVKVDNRHLSNRFFNNIFPWSNNNNQFDSSSNNYDIYSFIINIIWKNKFFISILRFIHILFIEFFFNFFG